MSATGRPRVLVDAGTQVDPEDRASLEAVADVVWLSGEDVLDEDGLIAALAGFRGMIRLGRRLPAVTARVLESCP
ncbi:MAG: hypothetical protein ABIL09_27115, partial [Gemmatimonadota bacterium]